MKYKITYWTAGDSLTERIVEVDKPEELKAEIEKLKDDPQAPLGQIKHVELLG